MPEIDTNSDDWVSTLTAANYLDRCQATILNYCKDDNGLLDCYQESKYKKVYVNRESLEKAALQMGIFHDELEDDTLGIPRSPKELRNLIYARKSIESIPLKPKHKKPLLQTINEFLEPLEKDWEREIQESKERRERNQPQPEVKILDFTTKEDNNE